MSVPLTSGTRGVGVGRVSAVLELLLDAGPAVATFDHTTGEFVPVTASLAAAPHGFLPLFLAAGDTVWREATGRSLGIELDRDPQTLLGHRVRAIGHPAFAPVMLSVMEAIAQVTRPDMLLVNDFQAPWLAAQERLLWRRRLATAPTTKPPTPDAMNGKPVPVQPRPIENPTRFGSMRP